MKPNCKDPDYKHTNRKTVLLKSFRKEAVVTSPGRLSYDDL